jgi:hypothetical protein
MAHQRGVANVLRTRGFSGSLPHLRRRLDDRVDLLSVQFHSAGGSFVVEVASCSPRGITTTSGKHIGPVTVTAEDIAPFRRPRLGMPDFPRRSGDHWFVFGSRSDEVEGSKRDEPADYPAVAAEVMRLIDLQAEPFWRSPPTAD